MAKTKNNVFVVKYQQGYYESSGFDWWQFRYTNDILKAYRFGNKGAAEDLIYQGRRLSGFVEDVPPMDDYPRGGSIEEYTVKTKMVAVVKNEEVK